MAHIVFADSTSAYDGRDLERRPLGGTESSVIYCARELARLGHRVDVLTHCDTPVEDRGVGWLPLNDAAAPECDLFVACQQPRLLPLGRRARRLALWVLWPASQLRHYKKLGYMWWFDPVPVFISRYQADTYSPLLPGKNPRIVIPHGLPDDVRGEQRRELPSAPAAIFASNPQRNLKGVLEIWCRDVLPRVPGAILNVYGNNGLSTGADPVAAWGGGVIPERARHLVGASIRIHAPVSREALIEAMRQSRAMVYLGHKAEAFCLSVAEAQALGVPAVVGDVTVLPERVVDGTTGFVCHDDAKFAEATVALLTDDALWRRQHEASLRLQKGIDWREHAERFAAALLS